MQEKRTDWGKGFLQKSLTAFLTDLPVLQMTSMALAQPSLVGERNIKIRSWSWKLGVYVNIKSQSGHSLSPFGCLPSVVWVYMMMCGIYGSGQQNNNKLAHYKWFRGNCDQPLSPPLTVKQRRAIGYRGPEGEPCLCMGALYIPPTPSCPEHTNCNTRTNPSSTSFQITRSFYPLLPKHKYVLP